MKVVCVNNNNDFYDLTIGKMYEVFGNFSDHYGDFGTIGDNSLEARYFPKKCFKSLSDYRNEKIDKLLAE